MHTLTILPGYEAQLDEDGVQHSVKKLESGRLALQELNGLACVPPEVVQLRPCQTSEETLGYRCQCSFQIVSNKLNGEGGAIYDNYQYAMRSGGNVLVLSSPTFPIANKSIQLSMERFLQNINDHSNKKYDSIRLNLTSCTFVSSWDENEVVLTLNYSRSILNIILKCHLDDISTSCHCKYVIARSKGKKVTNYDIQDQSDEAVICDFITTQGKRILYRKPVGAFQHPNPNVMHEALDWMLSCLKSIIEDYGQSKRNNLKLLEMYCGCGAHTMVLGKMEMFHRIVAVELDQRLVDSCIENCALNDLGNIVSVLKGDAGEFSKKVLTKQVRNSSNQNTWWEDSFDILLVDPPRWVI